MQTLPILIIALLSMLMPVIGIFSTYNIKQPVTGVSCGVSPKYCPNSQYRTIDGSCNNLMHKNWGTPNMPYGRLLTKTRCNVSVSGDPLPNARATSMLFFPNKIVLDKIWTLNVVYWGQLITHDMSLTAGISQTVTNPVRCCQNGEFTEKAETNPRCAPTVVPPNDPSHCSDKCIDFLKTLTTKNIHCTLRREPAEPVNAVNAFADLSVLYGLNDSHAISLRAGEGGRLDTVTRNDQEWPPQEPDSVNVCRVDSPSEPCYASGDVRSNQNPQLALLHVILLRAHNKIADDLSEINPHWDDERLYQEARRILIAIYQHITYYVYLPIILGKSNMLDKKLIYPETKDYVNDYDPLTNPSVEVEHATAAFRFLHTTIIGHLKKYFEDRDENGSIRLSDWLVKPSVIEINDTFSQLARGMNTQPQSVVDQFTDAEITEFLFRGPNKFGLDLITLDIERGRDHCLSSYNDVREYCGLPRADEFEDFADYISDEMIDKLSDSYESPDDVELLVGGSLEKRVRNTFFGPTFLCVILEQFRKTRHGDRFFYETGKKDIAFTKDQLNSIREGASLSRLFCDHVPGVERIQPRAFEQISEDNQLIDCEEIKSVDLSFWKETEKSGVSDRCCPGLTYKEIKKTVY